LQSWYSGGRAEAGFSSGESCALPDGFDNSVDRFVSRRRYVSVIRPLGVIWIAALVCVGCGRGQDRSLTLDDVIERNTAAMGGRAAIEAVQSIRVELHIKDPTFEADGVYYAARPGKMRIDVNVEGKHVFTEAFDGHNGWQGKDKQEPASEKATAALRHGVELPGKLFGLHELKERGHHLDSAGRETIDRVEYYVLRLTLNDGYPLSLYLDPKTWLITRRRDVRPLHVDIDPTPTTIEQVSSDFRDVDGVKFAFASTETDLKTGKILESTAIKSVVVNPSLPPGLFDKL
jgi:hypothetical protein